MAIRLTLQRFVPSTDSANTLQVNYRANVFGMKVLGVDWLLGVSAVGSLQEEIVPGQMVAVDQFIDRTISRPNTFYEEGIVGHVPFAEPICPTFREMLLKACKAAGATVHDGGIYVNMEGPAFSTKAESNLYRSWGARVIGMTALVEAKLAREAEMSYALMAMATDYDCWRDGHDAVTVEEVVATVKANVATAKKVIKEIAPLVKQFKGPCPQENVLRGAIMTAPDAIPAGRARALAPLVRKYVTIPPPDYTPCIIGTLAALLVSGAYLYYRRA